MWACCRSPINTNWVQVQVGPSKQRWADFWLVRPPERLTSFRTNHIFYIQMGTIWQWRRTWTAHYPALLVRYVRMVLKVKSAGQKHNHVTTASNSKLHLRNIAKRLVTFENTHQMWRLRTNFPLSYNSLPCLSLTRTGRAWMEERLRPSHCLICLGKALTSNTNLNDSGGNLGWVSEARLGLAQWPSLGEHGKFAGSICHRQRELRKRARREWLNGSEPSLALLWLEYEIIGTCISSKLSYRGCIRLWRAGHLRKGGVLPEAFPC